MRMMTLCMALLVFEGAALAQENKPEPPTPAKQGESAVKYAPHIKPEALWDGRKIAPFKALDFPKMVKASEADFLNDSDYVLGTTIHGESRAYPTRFIWWHHVINDKITDPKTKTDTFFAMTYCSVCNTGIRYDSTLKGKPVLLDFFGLYNGVVALCERETQSAFLQVSGEFVTGDLIGEKLSRATILDTTWGKWKRLHPNTLVMSDDTPYKRAYRPKDKPEPRGYTKFPLPFFRPTVTRSDLRLPPFDKTLGVAATQPNSAPGKETILRRVYPIKDLEASGGVINDSIGAVSVAIFFDAETVTANAVSRSLGGKTLTFEVKKDAEGKPHIYDKETSTRWNLEGVGEEGALAGKVLERIDNHLTQWYGWAAYFPETTIYGRTDPPQPGDPFKETGIEPPKP